MNGPTLYKHKVGCGYLISRPGWSIAKANITQLLKNEAVVGHIIITVLFIISNIIYLNNYIRGKNKNDKDETAKKKLKYISWHPIKLFFPS